MNQTVLNYPKYQTFFNNCLREWYYQYGRGTNFYYANPPGILFTRLRSTRNVKDYHVLEDMSQWYFKVTEIDKYSTNLQLNNAIQPKNSNNFYSNSYFSNFSGKILSSLHIGYDSWYSRIIAKMSTNSFNVAFCNSYDVAFNTFYNYSMAFESDLNKPFNNLRIITGNLFNLPLLINSQLFECVVLHLTNRNHKQLLNDRIIGSIHDVLVPWGCVVLITTKADINEKIHSFFPITHGDSLWVDSANNDYNQFILEDSKSNRIINNIKNFRNSKHTDDCTIYNNLNDCNEPTNDSNGTYETRSLNKLFINCFHKLKNPKPNNRLKKAVYTK